AVPARRAGSRPTARRTKRRGGVCYTEPYGSVYSRSTCGVQEENKKLGGVTRKKLDLSAAGRAGTPAEAGTVGALLMGETKIEFSGRAHLGEQSSCPYQISQVSAENAHGYGGASENHCLWFRCWRRASVSYRANE